jgi:hypothetical protein
MPPIVPTGEALSIAGSLIKDFRYDIGVAR